MREVPFFQDASHDGKRGDRHRRRHEQREGPELHPVGRQLLVQQPGHTKSECHRYDHGQNADPARSNELLANAHRQSQFGADDEHEKDQPELRQSVERPEAARIEDVLMHARRKSAEDCRTEHEPRCHLADDRRLAEIPQHESEHACRPENHDKLQQER